MQGVPRANVVRRQAAADQGPLDWLVPFIPPVLRVNRETRAEIRRKIAHSLSKEKLEGILLALRPHWRTLVCYSLVTVVWIGGLVYIHANEPEFAAAYVIFSGFAALGCHLLIGGDGHAGSMSAYSVFNRGTQRMLGSLSVEQFENEIRHRQVGHEDASRPEAVQADYGIDGHDEVYDENDPNLLAALKLSLQEKKREARRSRRATRRK